MELMHVQLQLVEYKASQDKTNDNKNILHQS